MNTALKILNRRWSSADPNLGASQDQLLTAQLNYTSELYIHKVAFLALRRLQGQLGVAVETGPQLPTIEPNVETQPATTQP